MRDLRRVTPHDLVGTPSLFVSNPPYVSPLIDSAFALAHRVMPREGQVGLLLPAYYFQTSSTVVRLAESWGLQQAMIPWNLHPGLSLPLTFAVFAKDVRRLMGFSLHQLTSSLHGMDADARTLLERVAPPPGRRSIWREAVLHALRQTGAGAQTLPPALRRLDRQAPDEHLGVARQGAAGGARHALLRPGRHGDHRVRMDAAPLAA